MESSAKTTSLKNNFLIAMPGLSDSIFANTITYICEHNTQGAMGLVINHPLDLSIDEIFTHLNIKDIPHSHHMRVMAGGPVEMNRGFVLHNNQEGQWQSTVKLSDEVSLTTSRDILDAIAHDRGPQDNLIALGYAGWAAGQLESEIAANAWLTMPADSHIIFKTPCEQRVLVATSQLGIDMNLIAPGAGHA